jgi:hypothetical protein
MHRKINKYTKIQYSRAVNEGERKGHKFWNIPINMHMGIHRGTDQPVAIMDTMYAHSKAHQRDISPYCIYSSLQKAREPSTNRVQS